MIDLLIGVAVPLAILFLYRTNKISQFTWRMFWLGCLIALTWETTLSALDGEGIVDLFTFATPPPVHYSAVIVSHTFWDGGIFLIGVWLVNLLCASPQFAPFNWKELIVLIVWGQVQEFAIEFISIANGGWEYNAQWWNPVLFLFNGKNITLVPQLIWVAAPIVFYFVALRVRRVTKG